MGGLVWVRYVGQCVMTLVNRQIRPGDERQVGVGAYRRLQREYPGKFELVTDCPSKDCRDG